MKRKLKPQIEKGIAAVTTILAMFVIMTNDMQMSFIPAYLLMVATVVINIAILAKYGKCEWLRK